MSRIAFIRSLEARIVELTTARDRFERKLTLARQLLEAEEGDVPNQKNTVKTATNKVLHKVSRRGTKPNSLVSQIRDVLASIGKPASPKEVTKVLEAKGVKARGKTKLQVSVNVELARLARNSISGVNRIEEGLYTLRSGIARSLIREAG